MIPGDFIQYYKSHVLNMTVIVNRGSGIDLVSQE